RRSPSYSAHLPGQETIRCTRYRFPPVADASYLLLSTAWAQVPPLGGDKAERQCVSLACLRCPSYRRSASGLLPDIRADGGRGRHRRGGRVLAGGAMLTVSTSSHS